MPFDNTPPALDVNDLISWLETKDPTIPYCSSSGSNCLICQWLSARTGEVVVYRRGAYRRGAVEGVYESPSRCFDMRALETTVARPNYQPFARETFGGALDRARRVARVVSHG